MGAVYWGFHPAHERTIGRAAFLIYCPRPAMSNEFDPYREALVIETATTWPDEYDDWEPANRQRVAELLHAEPAQASEMEYIRMHTGFLRQITVTPADIQRLSK